VGTDPSADPGAKTEGRTGTSCRCVFPFTLRDWHQSDKSFATKSRILSREIQHFTHRFW